MKLKNMKFENHPISIMLIIILVLIGSGVGMGIKVKSLLDQANEQIEQSNLQEQLEIAKEQGKFFRQIQEELTVEIPLTEEIIVNRNEFPTQERIYEIQDEIYQIAEKMNFDDTQLLFEIIECESSWRQFVKGKVGEIGLYQYYLRYHPDINEQCATNIRCSTEYAIEMIKQGRISEWSCYGIIEDTWI